MVAAAWSPLWSLWLPLGLRTQQAKLYPEEQLLQGWLMVEPVPHWRMDFGLRLFICVLGDLLSPLKPPRLEWRGASGTQIFWEASENLKKGTRENQAKLGYGQAWPSTVAAVASPINNSNK